MRSKLPIITQEGSWTHCEWFCENVSLILNGGQKESRLTDLRHQKDRLLGTESCVSVTCWNGVTVRLSPCLLLAGLQHLQRWFQGIAGYLHGKKHFCVSFQHTNWSVRSSLLRPVIRSFWHPKPLLNKLVKVTRPLHAVSLVQNFYTFLQFGNLQLTL